MGRKALQKFYSSSVYDWAAELRPKGVYDWAPVIMIFSFTTTTKMKARKIIIREA